MSVTPKWLPCFSLSVTPKQPRYVCLCQWLPMPKLSLSISVTPNDQLTFVYVSDSKWPLYVSLCQWLPNGHLTVVYVSDSKWPPSFVCQWHPNDTILLSLSVIPKRTPLFVRISDPKMVTLYSSISVPPKWTHFFLYQWLQNGHLMFLFISDSQRRFVDPRPSARKFLCNTRNKNLNII
jgi:hypothetical protein